MVKVINIDFKRFFDNSRDGLILADIKTKKLVEFNDAACQMLGYSPKEMKNLSVKDIHPKEFLPKAIKAFDSQAKVRPKLNKFFPVKRKGGKIIYADINTFLLSSKSGKKYLVGSFRDTTKRKMTEEKVRQKNSLLDSIVKSTADGLLVVGVSGKVEFFSDQFQKLWKIPADLVRTKDDKKLLDFVTSQLSDQQEFIDKVKYLYSNPDKESLDTIYFKDGRIFERFSMPQKIGNKIAGRVWSFRDVTKERELERARVEFLSFASHQLRTPLAGSKWVLELFAKDQDLSEKSKERIKDLYSSNEKLIGIVNILLNMSRMESGKFVANKIKVDLLSLIEDSQKMCYPNADKNCQKIEIKCDLKNRDAFVDPFLFGEAMNNIISNSINYGQVNSVINISLEMKGEDYLVSVHNSGSAISESDKKNIFEKFFRGLGAGYSGSGLGLYMAKKAVGANGGQIWFESADGAGTTFYFTIPSK